jgi:hypothetical protein
MFGYSLDMLSMDDVDDSASDDMSSSQYKDALVAAGLDKNDFEDGIKAVAIGNR